jgi:hypothetical protein
MCARPAESLFIACPASADLSRISPDRMDLVLPIQASNLDDISIQQHSSERYRRRIT